MILACLYNAPVSWYSLLNSNLGDIAIEICDNYTKQTYRNRCRILGANGVINLVIPVLRYHGKKTSMRDVRLDYDTPWHRTHWKSICSAYSSAPFFLYMEDAFYGFYERKYKFLADFNIELMHATLQQLGLNTELKSTGNYISLPPHKDARASIHPKRPFIHENYQYNTRPYHQVFSDRHGFIADLSILDLLFNEGPNAGIILLKSLAKKQDKNTLLSR